jgi:transposase
MAKRYSDEFKSQIVEMYNNGVRQCDLMKQFNLEKSTIRAWRKQHAVRGQFGSSETLSPEAIELKKLKKENEQLQKELNVLKHVALILGTKNC